MDVTLTNSLVALTIPTYCYAGKLIYFYYNNKVFTGTNKDNRISGTNELTIYHKSNAGTVWGASAAMTLISNFEYTSPEITLITLNT